MEATCGKARGEPSRKLLATVAPEDQRVAAQVVAHALQSQRALAANVQTRHPLLQGHQRPIDAVGEAYEPAALRIAHGELGRHPEGRQGGQIERRTASQRSLQPWQHAK